MRGLLAERLLSRIMSWSAEEATAELPALELLASFRYDGYRQFHTGMHFIERLAVWLSNFATKAERQTAFDFVKSRLVYLSSEQIYQLAALAYTDIIEPSLSSKTAEMLGVPDYRVGLITESDEFRLALRETLFLGLSDGARIDAFRRMSGINNEQVYATYQLPNPKASDLISKLRRDEESMKVTAGRQVGFRTVVLLDDFSGSGFSLIHKDGSSHDGKLVRCIKELKQLNDQIGFIVWDELSVVCLSYVATERALNTTQPLAEKWSTEAEWIPHVRIDAAYVLPVDVEVRPGDDPVLDSLLTSYYSEAINDEHILKGGPDAIYGFARCGLPLVLPHNTPNNSIYFLWAEGDAINTKALFPRVSRHRELFMEVQPTQEPQQPEGVT